MTATRALLPDDRLHFQHGPIDLVIGAEGDATAVAAAHASAWRRFETILGELVAELPALKRAVEPRDCPLDGAIARSMWHACRPHATAFVTPMAAVAGAVADAVIASYRIDGIDRAWVNNGGDIAIHLADGASVRVGLFADLARIDVATFRPDARIAIDGRFAIASTSAVRGIATSGWRGRSFSRGIADSVTVVARTAAAADAAATMVANAVDADDARIARRPASTLKDDSDLGEILVTVDVPPLGAETVRRALDAGCHHAERLRSAGLIEGCVLVCQGAWTGTSGAAAPPSAVEWHAPRFGAAMLEAA
jgi:ApbE superfamily uncharacterized protein (UPF0280 family)